MVPKAEAWNDATTCALLGDIPAGAAEAEGRATGGFRFAHGILLPSRKAVNESTE